MKQIVTRGGVQCALAPAVVISATGKLHEVAGSQATINRAYERDVTTVNRVCQPLLLVTPTGEGPDPLENLAAMGRVTLATANLLDLVPSLADDEVSTDVSESLLADRADRL